MCVSSGLIQRIHLEQQKIRTKQVQNRIKSEKSRKYNLQSLELCAESQYSHFESKHFKYKGVVAYMAQVDSNKEPREIRVLYIYACE